MADPVQFATTPLALASLAIIVGVGVLKLIVQGKNNALNRLITHYGFATVIVFGLVGNAIFLFSAYQQSEALVFGVVTDAQGKYLPRVEVDAGSHARGLSSDTGEFVLAIPASRAAEAYTLRAFRRGYEMQPLAVKHQPKMFVTLSMQEKVVLAQDVLKSASPDILIGHYMGLPEVYIPVALENPGNSPIALDNFTLRVIAPSGAEQQLSMVSSALSFNAPLLPPLTQIQLNPADSHRNVQVYGVPNAEIMQLSQIALAALQSQAPFVSGGPQVNAGFLPAPLVQQVQTSMNGHWFWEPGISTLVLTCNDNGVQYQLKKAITLTAAQIAAMRRISNYYSDGFGIYFGRHLQPVGSAAPGALVALSDA